MSEFVFKFRRPAKVVGYIGLIFSGLFFLVIGAGGGFLLYAMNMLDEALDMKISSPPTYATIIWRMVLMYRQTVIGLLTGLLFLVALTVYLNWKLIKATKEGRADLANVRRAVRWWVANSILGEILQVLFLVYIFPLYNATTLSGFAIRIPMIILVYLFNSEIGREVNKQQNTVSDDTSKKEK